MQWDAGHVVRACVTGRWGGTGIWTDSVGRGVEGLEAREVCEVDNNYLPSEHEAVSPRTQTAAGVDDCVAAGGTVDESLDGIQSCNGGQVGGLRGGGRAIGDRHNTRVPEAVEASLADSLWTQYGRVG